MHAAKPASILCGILVKHDTHNICQGGRCPDKAILVRLKAVKADHSHMLHTSERLRRQVPPPELQLTPEQRQQLLAALTGQSGNLQPLFPALTLQRSPGALHKSTHALMNPRMPHGR